MTTEHVLAVDVGGTTVKSALVAPDGSSVASSRTPTGRDGGPAAVVESLLRLVDDLVDGAAGRGSPVRAIGAALPGLVDEDAGVGVYSANLGWREVPVRALVEERTGLPVQISHDVRAGGVGEQRSGAGRGSRNTLFVAVGTGIGAAAVLSGVPYAGANGRAMELGHLQVEPGGERCRCGGVGCLETVASAVGIVADYVRRGGPGTATAEEVARLAATGDATAGAAWTRAMDALAAALHEAVLLMDPDVVVLGGGVSAAATLVDDVRDRLAASLTFQEPPRLVRAALGDMAGCLGAGMLAWDLVHRTRGVGAPAIGTAR